ncbi:MAG: hypothetical protein KIT46_04625 [Anaerolineales bacterium]|nr:hypothetical protein [Anaerolineales bacterium]MCW5855315.1 hypothetical protein [Anaerolineales bacterium]
MARPSNQRTRRRDRIEEVRFALGTLAGHLRMVRLRLEQARRVPGLSAVLGPGLDAADKMDAALARAGAALKKLEQE